MSRDRYRIGDPNAAHFFTATIVEWLPLFSRPEAARIVLDSWKFLHTNNRIRLYAYVILENHVHFIADGPDLSKSIQQFKSFTARQIIDFLQARDERSMLGHFERLKLHHKTESQFQVWQEGNHPVAIGSDSMMEQKLDYIHNNPVRRGYVDLPEHWRYSSMRNYLGQDGLIPVDIHWRG